MSVGESDDGGGRGRELDGAGGAESAAWQDGNATAEIDEAADSTEECACRCSNRLCCGSERI